MKSSTFELGLNLPRVFLFLQEESFLFRFDFQNKYKRFFELVRNIFGNVQKVI